MRLTPLPAAAFIVSLLGILVTAYLSYTHATGGVVACIGGGGCEAVQSSRYGAMLGVPLSYLGLGYYLTCAALSLASALNRAVRLPWGAPILFVLTLSGLLFSGYLTVLQAVVLHSFCAWCLTSAIIAAVLFVASLAALWRATTPPSDRVRA